MEKQLRKRKLTIFKDKIIRWIPTDNEYLFSVVDIVGALTESISPRECWARIKREVLAETGIDLATLCQSFKKRTPSGQLRPTDFANLAGIFQIIQSMHSPKSKLCCRWLAQVGYEGVLKIDPPELSQERMQKQYKQLYYSKIWINRLLKKIATPGGLIEKIDRGMEIPDLIIISSEIRQSTSELPVQELDLSNQNLPKEPPKFELLCTIRGEYLTLEIVKKKNSQPPATAPKPTDDSKRKYGRRIRRWGIYHLMQQAAANSPDHQEDHQG